MIEAKKRENESASSLLFRFSKRVRRSGVSLEVRKRRFRARPVTRRRRQLSAIYRSTKQKELSRAKKFGA